VSTGVTSTNALVDIVQFFSDNVFADLQASTDSVHPILQVDAIKYLYTFRNQVRAFKGEPATRCHAAHSMLLPPSPQLTKDQLLSVLPVLVAHLQSSNYVVYSYAAITIERILFIKQNGQLLCVPSSCATRLASE
jgi:exportin-2 (importin alpha re-exporter)